MAQSQRLRQSSWRRQFSWPRRLKFTRPFLRPTLHDHFGLRVKLNGVFALGVQRPEEALLPAAKGEKGHRRGDADVDAPCSFVLFIALLRGTAVLGAWGVAATKSKLVS